MTVQCSPAETILGAWGLQSAVGRLTRGGAKALPMSGIRVRWFCQANIRETCLTNISRPPDVAGVFVFVRTQSSRIDRKVGSNLTDQFIFSPLIL
jgi:hypothetical protein